MGSFFQWTPKVVVKMKQRRFRHQISSQGSYTIIEERPNRGTKLPVPYLTQISVVWISNVKDSWLDVLTTTRVQARSNRVI